MRTLISTIRYGRVRCQKCGKFYDMDSAHSC